MTADTPPDAPSGPSPDASDASDAPDGPPARPPPTYLTDEQVASGDWIPIKEVAEQTGITTEALAARNRRGTLDLVPTRRRGGKPYGYHLHKTKLAELLAELGPARTPTTTPPPPAPALDRSAVTEEEWDQYLTTSRIQDLEARVAALVRDNGVLTDALAHEHEHHARVVAQLEHELATLRTIHAQHDVELLDLVTRATRPSG